MLMIPYFQNIRFCYLFIGKYRFVKIFWITEILQIIVIYKKIPVF